MTITYTVGNGLYLNITNRCSNRCDFCIRNNGDSAYGSDSLWLEREPSEQEIWEAVVTANPDKYEEVVFCGYGEPSCRLDVMCSVAKKIKAAYNVPVRVNTNGQSSLINGRDTSSEFAVFDTVSVSLNSSTAEKYDEVCHSVYGKEAFAAILDFTAKTAKYVRNVQMSVVRSSQDDAEIESCAGICKKLGVKLRVREYIGK